MIYMKLRQTMLLLVVIFYTTSSTVKSDDSQIFKTKIRPILQNKCFDCHGEEEPEGEIRLENLTTDLLKNRPAAETWHEVLNVISRGEMPPKEVKI